MYDQMFDRALLDIGMDARGVAARADWEVDTGVLRTWLRKLRGLCTHPQVGQLLNAGDRDGAHTWFAAAAKLDADQETDAADRLAELEGVVIEFDDFEDDESVAGPEHSGGGRTESGHAGVDPSDPPQ